ncbi:hypothetical protein DFS34DRAFT_639692 [Phlyctochytrium arcticum]|nr:hypothetical protein DFS34DRAFT_639692 [Phlyctochytrium arcticum]
MASYTYPAFQLRQPLGRGFPTSNANAKQPRSSSHSRRPRSSPSPTHPSTQHHQHVDLGQIARPGSRSRSRNVCKSPERSSVEDEYVKNLQQQIYLLELETRYLRTGKQGVDDTPFPLQHGANAKNGGDDMISLTTQSAPLNDVIRGLKIKYVELQEGHKRETQKLQDTIQKLQTANRISTLQQTSLTQERDTLTTDLKTMKDMHNSEKDGLYHTIHSLRQENENLKAEGKRWELSYERCREEKEILGANAAEIKSEIEKLNGQVQEQLTINDKLKRKYEEMSREKQRLEAKLENTGKPDEDVIDPSQIEGLEATIRDLRTQLNQAQTMQQQSDHLRLKISADCSDLVKLNVELRGEIDSLRDQLRREKDRRDDKSRGRAEWMKEAEREREEGERFRDEVGMYRIKIEVGEKKNLELIEKMKVAEIALQKATEARAALNERIKSLENRLHEQTLQLVQVNQDKSLLVDDLAALRNTHALNIKKLQAAIAQTHELKIEIEAYKRDGKGKEELERLLREVEWSGESYLGLMKGVREFMRGKGFLTEGGRKGEDTHDSGGKSLEDKRNEQQSDDEA